MIVRGFRARLAATASLVHDHKCPSHVSGPLVLVVDWFFYWTMPCTWRRVWPALRSWARVRVVFPVLALVLKRPRYPFDDARLNRRSAR